MKIERNPLLRALCILGLGLGTTAPCSLASNPVPDWVTGAASSALLPRYPAETKAVILLDDDLITVGPDGKTTERERKVVKILRPQGREYAEIVAEYSKDNKLNSFHAWSIGPDGHQYSIKDEEVHDEALGEWGILYDDLRGKVVHAPGSDPGGVVAYEVVRQVANYGELEQTWDFQESIPIHRAVFEVDLPPGWKNYTAWLHHEAVNGTEVAPNHWHWELQEVPAIDLSDVPMAPSEEALAGRMVIHYSASDLPTGDQRWAEIGNWYDILASPRTEAPREIDVKAKEVAGRGDRFQEQDSECCRLHAARNSLCGHRDRDWRLSAALGRRRLQIPLWRLQGQSDAADLNAERGWGPRHLGDGRQPSRLRRSRPAVQRRESHDRGHRDAAGV